MKLQRRYKHFHRYRDVVQTLAKHGFDFLIKQIGLTEFLRGRKYTPEEELEDSTAKRLRLAIEELGTTFIKVGQLLSTRPDLIPKEWTIELSKLQDEVPPFSFMEVREQVETELGHTLEDLFSSIEAEPLASASIGQVHRATLHGGEKVAIKVQRPDIEETIKTDLEILHDLARLLEKHTDWASMYNLRDLVIEFEDILTNELNYLNEGQNMDIFRKNFKGDKRTFVPEVYWDYTTKRVLTMEYVKAVKLTDSEKLYKMNVDMEKVVTSLCEVVFKQIFMDGVFHGDPHPGNVMVFPDSRIVLLDFGIVGVIDEELKEKFGDLLIAQVSRNNEAILRNFLSLGLAPPDINRRELRQDIERMQHKYYDMPLSKIKLGEVMKEFLEVAFDYNIKLPTEFTLLAKAMIILEGIISRLAPQLSLMEIAEPFGKDLTKRRFTYDHIKKTLSKNIQEYGEILGNIPRQLTDLFNILEKGQFKVTLEHKDIREFLSELNHMINRLAFSLVLASLIVGLSLIVQGIEHSILWRIPLAEIGFIVAGAMGFWLLISIIRSGRF
ncbi:MAG: AarF/ABC1/UbiB kinase family protein [Candidatus Syntrophonatronum acetioxidans]|uniref:AarF/ABC1/UbiB kinase family protein n=1 Tax=Candidatus Syntrophonatronum acetioxidans TaxID=1795816 RepID=A0A424YI25_9FIRM|nr:MAG: AarF/ABC1/UbiB kinase family protein [Candidatus Syntrophonatronum acetioxidans]